MSRGAEILSYAVRPQVTLRVFGRLCLASIPLFAVPALVALSAGETGFAARLGVCAGAAGLLGLALGRLRGGNPRLNEVMVVSALAFAGPPVALAWTFGALGYAFIPSLFEAVSGVTTTGLSVLPRPEASNAALDFTRAWMQWVGGLGFIVLVLGLMGATGAQAARRLGEAGGIASDPVANLRERARRMLSVYLGLTLICAALLWATGPGAWDALLYAMTALATGGFAPDPASAAALEGPAPRIVLAVFTLLGAISFSLYLRALRGRGPGEALRADLIGLAGFLAIGAGGLLAILALYGGLDGPTIGHALFTAVSAQTNAGFSTMTEATLPAAALAWLMLAMLIGGNSGSTAGGVKTFRALTLVALMRLTLQRPSLPPDAVARLTLFGRPVGAAELQNAAAVISLAAATIFFAWLPFLAAGYGADALFDVVSAVSTTGLSAGVVSPELPQHLQATLVVAMLLGRVEFIALLIVIWPPTWIGPQLKD